MVSGTMQQTRSDGPISTSLVYFRVLDLRVRYRLVNGKQIRPYCVLRLGNGHHRSGTFPPEGLQVHSRRTTVDDRQVSASDDGDADNPGVLWEIPTSFVTPNSCPSHGGMTRDCGDNQAQGRRQECERQEDPSFQDSCQELLVEVYNTADMDTGLSIEGFEAEMLGVLRIKLSDIWTREIRYHPAAGCKLADTQAGLGESREGKVRSTQPAGHSDATSRACDVAETQCRTDRWFGGIVPPSSSCQHNSNASGGIPASGDYIVETRLEVSWCGCTLARSKKPCHDSFGQAVDPRNTSKSLSAQSLWELQEPLQRKRWKSEVGRTVLSAFEARSRRVESPRIKRRNARGVEEWESELRDLVWNGVPREMREEVYMSLSGASSKQKLFESGYYQSLVNTCDQLEGKGNDTHNAARERKENESGDTVKSGQSNSRRQDEKLVTTSDLLSEHTVPATPVSPLLPPNPLSHTTDRQVCRESTSTSSGSIDSSSWCSHGVADQRTRSTGNPRQNSMDCREGIGLNGVSRKRCAFKDDASSLAQGGSVTDDAGPMPCTDRSLQGARNEKQEDGRSSSGLLKLADDSFAPQEMEAQRQVWREIEGDVDRVFANGKSRVNSATGMATIRRLLRAYSIHNPAVGYCQGMNFVAGFLLEVVSEEAAFWLLDFFCEDLNPEYHTKSMLGARSDIAALKDVLRSELPRFHSRAREVDMPLELKLTQWLVVGFVNCFPPCTALRIFEVSFLEGSDVYFATALAFLRLHEAEILLGEDIADVVCTLDRAQDGMYEADILLNQAWRELTLRGKEIRMARVRHRNRVLRQQEALTEMPVKGPRMDSGAWYGADGHAADERDGWLQGRSSTGSGGSAWLVLVPKALADQMQAILFSLNKKTIGTARGALTDGKLVRPSLMPLLVGGVRWLMGGRNH